MIRQSQIYLWSPDTESSSNSPPRPLMCRRSLERWSVSVPHQPVILTTPSVQVQLPRNPLACFQVPSEYNVTSPFINHDQVPTSDCPTSVAVLRAGFVDG